jgi:integrase
MGVIQQYGTWTKAAGLSEGTIRLRLYYLQRLAAQTSAGLLTLGPDDLAGFLAQDWKPETRKSARAAIRSFYRWAVETERLAVDPSRFLPSVRVPPGRPRPAPDDVFHTAMAQATARERLMLMLAAFAGLRRSEIAAVHSRDVQGDMLRVCGKGGRVRLIPLHPDLLAVLYSLPEGWVFPTYRGHLTPGHVGVTLKRLLGPDWSAHTLRHRFAGRAYLAERDLRAVQTLLGHSKPETTARYVAVPEGAMRAAVLAAGDAA